MEEEEKEKGKGRRGGGSGEVGWRGRVVASGQPGVVAGGLTNTVVVPKDARLPFCFHRPFFVSFPYDPTWRNCDSSARLCSRPPPTYPRRPPKIRARYYLSADCSGSRREAARRDAALQPRPSIRGPARPLPIPAQFNYQHFIKSIDNQPSCLRLPKLMSRLAAISSAAPLLPISGEGCARVARQKTLKLIFPPVAVVRVERPKDVDPVSRGWDIRAECYAKTSYNFHAKRLRSRVYQLLRLGSFFPGVIPNFAPLRRILFHVENRIIIAAAQRLVSRRGDAAHPGGRRSGHKIDKTRQR